MCHIKVILVHGFSKSSKDMRPLQQNLALFGYECFMPDLQLTFKETAVSTFLLEGFLENLIQLELIEDECIHLVGHSTGGLIIRQLLSMTKYRDKIGRCVLIATPNNGSYLATMAGNLKPYVEIFKTLKSLHYEEVRKFNMACQHEVEMAAIAGNKNNLMLGQLIGKENDGRVEVESVYFSQLKDFTVLPYGHKEIHHQMTTAKYVDAFLKNGTF